MFFISFSSSFFTLGPSVYITILVEIDQKQVYFVVLIKKDW